MRISDWSSDVCSSDLTTPFSARKSISPHPLQSPLPRQPPHPTSRRLARARRRCVTLSPLGRGNNVTLAPLAGRGRGPRSGRVRGRSLGRTPSAAIHPDHSILDCLFERPGISACVVVPLTPANRCCLVAAFLPCPRSP